nr:YggT family protein [Maliibacterium massiliense]
MNGAAAVVVPILQGVNIFIGVLVAVIFINAILSWILPPFNKVRVTLDRIVAPILNPFRRLFMRFSKGRLPIDLSPILAYLALLLVQQLLQMLILSMMRVY